MGLRIQERGEVVKGIPVVQPGDDLFWFNHPRLLLYLIHFVLFQYEFGFRSCFHEKKEDIIIRITMGVLVQILCSYVTLPLYALVTQMGSTMKPTVFNETVAKAIRTWHHTARKHIKQKRHVDAVTVTPLPLPSQPSPPSPVHSLRYYSGDSSYAVEKQRAGQIEQHSQYCEAASSWSHNGENDDIMQNREQIRKQSDSEPVLQIHKFQHEVDVESSADFSFTRK